MIYIVTGKTGHGKTAYCIQWVRDALANGRVIYSNTKINPRAMFSKRKYAKLFGDGEIEGDIINASDRDSKRILYWQNFSDWQYFKNGLVLTDEGIVYFNARKWELLPDHMQMRFVQHRKDELDLLVNVQNYTFIDKTLRVLCERFINVELKIGSARFKKTFLPRFSKVVEVDLPTLNKCENLGIDPYNILEEEQERVKIKPLYSEWFWISQRKFSWYDTGLKMVEPRAEPFIHSVKKCLQCDFTKLIHN